MTRTPRPFVLFASSLLLCLVAAGCAEPERQTPADPNPNPTVMTDDANDPSPDANAKTELATFGGGCFWCTEAVLEQLDGVYDVVSGYTGGHVDNPNYRQICEGNTGHAEVVQVKFDPAKISYVTLLEWFFRSHNPTTLNRQGPDVGTQYRSAIFTHSDEQHQLAVKLIESIEGNFEDPIVTEVTPLEKFWPAEDYHQDYFRNNPDKGYCQVMIAPKLKKLGLDSK